jgi:polysaccharide pyruvyl transferase WcaK-like protein
MKEYVNVFIGMRFHSIIFASEAGKPVLCIPYERKITEFLKERQSDPAISTIPLDSPESSKIIKFVEEKTKPVLQWKTAV